MIVSQILNYEVVLYTFATYLKKGLIAMNYSTSISLLVNIFFVVPFFLVTI